MTRLWVLVGMVVSLGIPTIAQSREDEQNSGEELSQCVEAAISRHSGPDFTQRYVAIRECQLLHPYEYDPASTTIQPGPPVEQPDFGRMREIAEAYIRSRLVDPNSAEFDWPYGFTNSSWKPFLRKQIDGYVTCGFVNAKNRMGGYAGRNAFVVVMNNYRIDFAQLGDVGPYDVVGKSCAKSASRFVAPQPDMLEVPESRGAEALVSVADELSKLAELRDRGVITASEFEEQKRRLLSQ